ncbi:MAG: HAMP domain-containing sensor histidine kinase [Mobilitalea sp.]
MKLRTKIFISILIISLATLTISSYYLINRNHISNVQREKERSLNEFSFLINTLDNGINAQGTKEELKPLFVRYVEYYKTRGILLMIYDDKEPYVVDFPELSEASYQPLLLVKEGTRQLQVIESENEHYFFVSGKLTKIRDYTIVYARNISNIYDLRLQSIYLSLLLTATLIVLLGFLSYRYSKWITKPIELLNQNAKDISLGNYSIRSIPTKDEFHTLGNAFNQMASSVEAHTAQLEEKAKELQEFIDALSHEMNTPLTSIQGYSEFLINANATENQKQKAATNIHLESKRMKDIYIRLMQLTLTRVQDLELSSVSIASLFHELEERFILQLSKQQITLNQQIGLHQITLDYTLILMLLSNLLKNSIQALPNGGAIAIKSYLLNTNPVIEVSDNGYGIPKDKINDITKPFYRVDKSRSRKTGGAGLGLSICKNIASLHNAEMVIQSKEGEGTSIQVIFYNSVTTS